MRFLPLLLCAVSVFAQFSSSIRNSPGVDLTANWAPVLHEDQPERIPGPEPVNYSGLPINEGARLFADSWNASRLTVPEHQCQVHVAPYIYRGPLNLRIWDHRDPATQQLIGLKQYISTYEQERIIYLDGRPHPPAEAPHSWMGFSTGQWMGNILVVNTTHIKQGWVRRNGLPESDQATLTEYFIRHGDTMTHVSIAYDPVYLTEPLIKSQDFRTVAAEGQNWLYPCEPVVEVANRPRGAAPHYLPGENPFQREYADRYGLTSEAVLGGAATMYPEFRAKMPDSMPRKTVVPPTGR